MNKITKVPKLRFPKFTDEWEQRKFVETFDFLPNNSLSRAQLTYENGTVKNVHYGDVLIKFGELLDVGNEELPYLIDDTLIKNYSSAVLKNGDVVIADAAEDETVGKCSEIKGIKDEKILSGLHTIPVRPRVEFENGYLGYFMNSHSYHDQLLPLIQGTKVSSISKKVLENTVISYPASSSEQEKIATFFENLTNLITLHQRKLDNLNSIKKSMLDKLFPKKGEKCPEVRFEGFTGEWEQRKLGDVTEEFRSGSFIPASDISDKGEYPVYGGNGLRGYTNTYNHDGEFALIGRQGALCGNMNYSVGKAYFTEHAVAVKANSLSDTKFLYYLLSIMRLGQYSAQSAQPGLAVGKLINLQNMFPRGNEQHRIGEFFSNLDNLITLHQRKLDNLYNIKKGFLQQMFA